MGSGAKVICDRCGFESLITEGAGFKYPAVSEELKRKAQDGEYGDKFRTVVKENPGGSVNGESRLYVCRKCGSWKVEPKLSYYIPSGEKETFFEEAGLTRRLFTYRHRCDECGHIMHEVDFDGRQELKCPDCGEILRVTAGIMWD